MNGESKTLEIEKQRKVGYLDGTTSVFFQGL